MSSMFRSLRHYNYRVWFFGALVSNIGTWMQRIAQDWLVLTVLTDESGVSVGVTTMLQFAPAVVLAPWAGAVVDRVDKRHVLIATQLASALTALALGVLVLTDTCELFHVYVFAAVLGAATAFDFPTRHAFVGEVVGAKDLSNAVSLNSASYNVGRIIGPASAGLLIAGVGIGPVFIINAGTYCATLLALLRMHLHELAPKQPAPRTPGQIRSALRYALDQPAIMLVLSVVLLVGGFGNNFELTTALMARLEYERGAGEYGLFVSLFAIGSLAGALMSAHRERPRLRVVLAGAAWFGVANIAAAAASLTTYWVFALSLVPVGMALLNLMTTANATVQLSTAPSMRGRVIALYMMVMMGGTAVASPLIGWLGQTFGPRTTLVCSGSASIVIAGAAALIYLRRRGLTAAFRNRPPRLVVLARVRPPPAGQQPAPTSTTSPRRAMSTPKYQLVHPHGTIELPFVSATEGPPGVDVSGLLSAAGVVAVDHGFVNTASCVSSITSVDGDNGVLRYRGYPIEDLAQKATFLEVAYLLMNGSLPDAVTLQDFDLSLRGQTALPTAMAPLFQAFGPQAHPMPVLSSGILALSTHYPDALDPLVQEQRDRAATTLLAKAPTIASHAHLSRRGVPVPDPDPGLDLVENFLHQTLGPQVGANATAPSLVKAMNLLFILHADHEQNCSTSAVRLVGSSHANLYASVSAGVNALHGPLHGGANQAVLHMLESIRDDGSDVAGFVERVKRRKSGVRLMGFGHRVYKNYDPRAAIVKSSMDSVLGALGVHDELLDIALRLEEIALRDDYFLQRRLYPNVDFYTGLIYKAMGYDADMFTPLFALGRLPGWIAQWQEMITDEQTKIGRPRQIYVGPSARSLDTHVVPA
jgi:citrate synthase